ncbi:hypothetical protein N8813_01125 [bacterium]|jgi:hypothetical protein|nr:hypothetical protein [bacterium]MDC0259296.1 hypothetical protein [Verrucomicrobiales bacterium]MDC0276195.1 hypothetical protein [Verrucomicrobiales bacterium]MDC0322290.1 hypothetical protein [Verrucomicrobiales bacterium]
MAWSHHLEIPVTYHAPKIFEFDDGESLLRLAKVGKRFGDFFVIDENEVAHPWTAGFDQPFSGCIAAPFKLILYAITLTKWQPPYNQPLIGSPILARMSDLEQKKAIVLTATIRMWLDESDFSQSS